MSTVSKGAAVQLSKGDDRAFNFSAGPGVIAEDVLKQAQEDVWSIFGSGMGILEHSHRGKAFDRVLEEAIEDCRRVGNIPDDYEVMFLQGGATTQCFHIPMAFLPQDRTADYFETGKWAQDAIHEAKLYGGVHLAYSGADGKFSALPDDDQVNYSDNPAYVHYVSNNTIMGTQWHRTPPTPGNASGQDGWFVCDASSDIYCRPIDVTDFGMVYAGGQKNLGPAGTVLVLMRKDLLERQVREMPWMLDYALLAKKQSRYNTPPTFGIYLMGQSFKWIERQGGLENMREHNESKAKVLYDALDTSSFYVPHARVTDRSLMNVTFKTPSADLDKKFIADAEEAGLMNLAGHRSIGGMRASIYNAMPREGCEALVTFMNDFEQQNG